MYVLLYAVILVDTNDLLVKLVEMVLCYPAGSHEITALSHDITAGSHDITAGSHDISAAERELDPSHMAIHLIKEIAQGNDMCQEILCKVVTTNLYAVVV